MSDSRFHLSGAVTFGTGLGALCSVVPVVSPGGNPHIIAHFLGGARLEIGPYDAAELARRLPECIASLAKSVDCSAIFTEIGGEQ